MCLLTGGLLLEGRTGAGSRCSPAHTIGGKVARKLLAVKSRTVDSGFFELIGKQHGNVILTCTTEESDLGLSRHQYPARRNSRNLQVKYSTSSPANCLS